MLRAQLPQTEGPGQRRAHCQPVPPGFQPKSLCREGKAQTARRHAQRQQAVVDPGVGKAEPLGAQAGQHRRLPGIEKAQPGVGGEKEPTFCKGKPDG